jgi:hypothetical protein
MEGDSRELDDAHDPGLDAEFSVEVEEVVEVL